MTSIASVVGCLPAFASSRHIIILALVSHGRLRHFNFLRLPLGTMRFPAPSVQLIALALAAHLASGFTPLSSSSSNVAARSSVAPSVGASTTTTTSGNPLMMRIKMVATNAEAEATAVADVEAVMGQKRKKTKEVSGFVPSLEN